MKLYRVDETAIESDHDFGPDWHWLKLGIMRDRGTLVPVDPCEHGKYDGHWPKRKCHCHTDKTEGKGVWNLSTLYPHERHWVSCWHEPWCVGAGLDESQEPVMAQTIEETT